MADRVEQTGHAERGYIPGKDGLRPRGLDEALRGEVIDFLRIAFFERQLQRRLIQHIAGDKMQLVLDMVDPAEINGAGPANQAKDLVSLAEQKFGQIGSVLPRDSGDECALAHDLTPPGRSARAGSP